MVGGGVLGGQLGVGGEGKLALMKKIAFNDVCREESVCPRLNF